jgi:hypothetical protein
MVFSLSLSLSQGSGPFAALFSSLGAPKQRNNSKKVEGNKEKPKENNFQKKKKKKSRIKGSFRLSYDSLSLVYFPFIDLSK